MVGNTLGTLTIGRANTPRYVGKLAGSEYLLEVRYSPYGDAGWEGRINIQSIRGRLPVREEEGRSLVEIYWNNVDWM